MDGIDGISQLLGPLRGLDPPARGSEVLLDFDEEQAQIVNQVASRGFPFLLAFFFASLSFTPLPPAEALLCRFSTASMPCEWREWNEWREWRYSMPHPALLCRSVQF